MLRLRTPLLALALCSLTVVPALAGERQDRPVEMVQGNGITFAYGSMGSTRNVGGANDYLGCWVENIGRHNTGGCAARAGSLQGQCVFPVEFEYFMMALNSLTPQSYVVVAWDQSGECQYLQVYEESLDPPKLWP